MAQEISTVHRPPNPWDVLIGICFGAQLTCFGLRLAERDAHGGDCGIDCLLMVDIEMGSALVHDEDLGLPVKCTGKQHALLLPARERRAHVADQGLVLHRHADNIVVDRCRGCGFHDALHIDDIVKQRDVVGKTAGK